MMHPSAFGLTPQLVSHLVNYLTLVRHMIARQHDLNMLAFLALTTISSRGTLSFKALRQMLPMPKSTLTVVVDSLEEKGIVERQRDPQDRRQWAVRLTHEGSRIAREISIEEAAVVAGDLSKIEPIEQEETAHSLQALARLVFNAGRSSKG
ncbi:MAG: MarR family transcriptional regulator [Chloroflexi bacterium]|nr:MarR family transcriptional regulator [Chloroflexota bacterium]